MGLLRHLGVVLPALLAAACAGLGSSPGSHPHLPHSASSQSLPKLISNTSLATRSSPSPSGSTQAQRLAAPHERRERENVSRWCERREPGRGLGGDGGGRRCGDAIWALGACTQAKGRSASVEMARAARRHQDQKKRRACTNETERPEAWGAWGNRRAATCHLVCVPWARGRGRGVCGHGTWLGM